MEAQAEARFLMLSANNILKPQDGKPVVSPTQDMVLGCYYLTIIRPGAKGEGKYFADVDEALMAYATGELSLQAKCHIRLTRTWQGEEHQKVVETTIGRVIFNPVSYTHLFGAKRAPETGKLVSLPQNIATDS